MNKSLKKNSLFYLFYNVLNMLFPFVSSLYVARVLLPKSVGEVAYAQNVVSYFSILAFLGIPTYGIKAIAKARDSREEMDAEVERLKGQVDVAKLLGARVMRHDVCYTLSRTGNGRSFDRMLPFIADNARKVTGYAQTQGVRTCTENHGYIAQDSDRVERLFNAVAHDNYGLLVDVGNFICVDENPAAAVSRVAPYAFHVHVKDFILSAEPTPACKNMSRGGNFWRGTVVGEGDVPVKKCLQILKRAGYDEFVSLEYEGVEDCIDGITRGLANVKAMLAELI